MFPRVPKNEEDLQRLPLLSSSHSNQISYHEIPYQKDVIMDNSKDERIQRKKNRLSSSNSSNSSTYDESTARRVFIISGLLMFMGTFQMSLTIRVGFLAQSFERRGIAGKVYGMVEGCLLFGYIATFLSRGSEYAMTHIKSKYLMIFVLMGCSISSLITGFVYLVENNTVMVSVSIVIRLLQGIVSYLGFLLAMDFVAVRYPKHFDALNGALGTSCYVGHGLAETVGSKLYEQYGYIAPFVFVACACLISTVLVAAVIPACPCLLALEVPDDGKKKANSRESGVTYMIIGPVIATMLVNSNYGFLQVTVTPYLYDTHGLSLSYGGLVLASASAGIATGALVFGFILQKEIFRPITQMTLGATMVAIGMFLTFPSPSWKLLYEYAYILAFPTAFVAGFGDPVITNAALRYMYRMQFGVNLYFTSL